MNPRSTGLAKFSSAYLRLALGISFLSAVADRFGVWGVYGQPNVAWGNYSRFVNYTAKLNWFLPAAMIPALSIIVTAAETLFGLLLIVGWKTRITALLSGVLLTCFALTMTVTLGVKSPLNFSIFSAAGGALLLGMCTDFPFSLADTIRWHLVVKDRINQNAARAYLKPTDDRAALEGHLTFFWDKMDAWFEEDEQVFVHPRDPYTRVDTVHSSRHVRVEIDGVTMAETRRPILLFETGLPTRYYILKLDVRIDLLEPSEYVTRCPYKGVASHWSAWLGGKLVKDIVWSYPAPIPECPKIENLLSFYNEHVDLYVDGVLQDRPITPFS